MVVPLREGGLAGIWSSVQWVRHSLSSQSIIYHLQLWKRSSWTPGMACQWVHHFSAVQSCCSTGSIIITIIIWDRETGTCKVSTATFSCRFLPKLLVAFLSPCLWWLKTGLHTAHTMGGPGAACVLAGRPRPVPSYPAIVNILGDGVSLTVILSGYLYGKHQLRGWWGYNAKVNISLPKG